MNEAVIPQNNGEPWADRGWYLCVEFQQSSSAGFDRAVQMASKLPGFSVLIDEAGICVYRVVCREDKLSAMPRLLHLIAGWKQTKLYVCGRETTVSAIDSWLPCYKKCRRERYPLCRHEPTPDSMDRRIGCFWAGISLAISDWDTWYRHSVLNGKDTFRVQKEVLAERIDSWRVMYGGCPFANERMLRRVVAILPDTIDMRQDRRWRIVESQNFFQSSMLCPRSGEDYFEFMRERLASLR